MMLHRKSRKVGLAVAVILGVALFEPTVHGQDAAWEGLINAGRNALQQQNFSEAERHFEAALEAAETFPSGDSRLGKSYNNLAAVYYAQEDYARAEPLMRRALAQLRETLGPENTEVAQTMKNLAALYYLQGNRSEAEALLKQSLEILERVHGPNHAFVATVLSNLAGLYQAENRYRDAEPLLTRSLAIWESLLGSEHPDVVRSRALLEQVRSAQAGRGSLGTAAAEPNEPTSLVPEAESQASEPPATSRSDVAAEIAKATQALEQLTKTADNVEAIAALSSTEGDAGPEPSPSRNLAVSELGIDSAASPQEIEEPGTAGVANEDGEGDVENEPVTSALADDITRQEKEKTVAILDDATSVDDVSFSIYLSTLWSIDEAQRYWQAMQNALPDVLEGKRLEIEEVAAGTGPDPFYRVLTFPFTSDPEAQAACEQIKSKLRTHDCSVVIRDKTEVAGG